MLSLVRCEPLIGHVKSHVDVEWHLGYDVVWTPTTNDELRLLTTSGVLVSRVSMRNAKFVAPPTINALNTSNSTSTTTSSAFFPSASAVPSNVGTLRDAVCRLPTGSFGGSFVVAFVDCNANFRRVYTVPFRIIGPEYLPSRTMAFVGHDPAVRFDPSAAQRGVSSFRPPFSPTAAVDVSQSAGDSTLSMEPTPVSHTCYPLERLTVRFDANVLLECTAEELPTLRFVMCKAQLGDNAGFNEFGQGLYDHCASVARVPEEAMPHVILRSLPPDGPSYRTVELVAPATEGTYDVRLMKTPKNGFPFSIAASEGVRVAPLPGPRPTRGSLYGTLSLDRTKVMVGEPIQMTYHVHSSDTHLLSQFDSLAFYPYGRPEAIRHAESLQMSILETVGRKTLTARAPTEAGAYEVALFSFMEQQPVLVSTTLHVLEPKLLVRLQPQSGSGAEDDGCLERSLSPPPALMRQRLAFNGKTVWSTPSMSTLTMEVFVPKFLFHPRDRLLLVDESSNVVFHGAITMSSSSSTSAPVVMLFDEREYADCCTDMAYGTCNVRHPIPGKYTVHYFSFVNERVMYQAPLYLELVSGSGGSGGPSWQPHQEERCHYPTGALSALSILPDSEPIEVNFKKEGVDHRCPELQMQDCVCLYVRDMSDAVATRFVDDADAMPCLATRYLRGQSHDEFKFPSLQGIISMIEHSLLTAASLGSRDNEGDGRETVGGVAGGGRKQSLNNNSNNSNNTSGTEIPSRSRSRRLDNSGITGSSSSASSASCGVIQGGFFNKRTLEAVRHTSSFSIRYMAAIHGSFHRVCLSEASVTILPRSKMPEGFRAIPLRHVAVRELAPVSHRLTSAMTSDGRVSSAVTPVALSRRHAKDEYSSNVFTPTNAASLQKTQRSGTSSLVRMLRQDQHEFAGAVLAPASGLTSEPLIVTYHVTSGVPRSQDNIVLLAVGGSTAVSECVISLATDARPDLTLGTVLLKPPALEGSYVAGYFSDLYDGVVLISSTIRVATSDDVLASHAQDASQRRRGVGGGPRTIGGGAGNSLPSSSPGSAAASPRGAAAGGGVNAYAALRNVLKPSTAAAAATRLPRTKVLIAAASYLQQPHELKGPLNDAEAFEALAKKYFIRRDANAAYPFTARSSSSAGRSPLSAIDEDEDTGTGSLLRVLHEAKASPTRRPTADNILQGFRWLTEDAMDGDHLIFYFSGAGSIMPDGTRCLLPTDFDWGLRIISPDILSEALLMKAPELSMVSVFLDCSYYSTTLETFRRGELRLLSAGDEESHLGWTGLQRRRKYRGVGSAPWRCVPPPKGTHPEDFGAALGVTPAHLGPLMDASLLLSNVAMPPSSQTKRPLAVVYEASCGSHGISDGAWDVFLRDSSVTRGLFSHHLCSIIEREYESESSSSTEHSASSSSRRPPMAWFELHESIVRAMESSSYRQHPRLWVGSDLVLTMPVRGLPM